MSKQVTLRLDEALLKRLEERAEKEKRSKQAVIEIAIAAYLSQQEYIQAILDGMHAVTCTGDIDANRVWLNRQGFTGSDDDICEKARQDLASVIDISEKELKDISTFDLLGVAFAKMSHINKFFT